MTIKEVRAHVADLAAETTVLAAKWQVLADDMQSEFDERTEKWQESDKGDDWQCMIDDVEMHISCLEEVADFEIP